MNRTIKYKQFYILICSLLFLANNGLSQNFRGGIDDGYSFSSIVNTNLNSVPEYFSVEITLADGQVSPSSASIINFKATFDINTSNFSASDVIVGGTANPSSTSVITGGPLIYNIAVSGMTNDGIVNVTIPAGVCTDNIIGSQNAASVNTANVVDYQTKPEVTINQASGQSDPTRTSPVNFTVTFSEPVTGFLENDITLSGTAGATTVVLSGTGPEYNIAVSGMTQNGTVVINIPDNVCIDLAGNPNTTSVNSDNSVNYNITVPGVTIEQAFGQSDPTGISPINFTVTFSEPVTGFNESDITLSGTAGASTVLISGTGPAYNIAVSGMTQNGTVVINIPDNVCIDLAGNPNTTSVNTDNSVNYDITVPGVTIEQAFGQSDPTGISPINFTVTFSEPVTGFNESDITLSGTAGASTVLISGTGPAYNIAVSGMTQNGTVVINIPDNVCIDLAGNPNTTSVNTDNSVNYDITVPGVTIEQASGQSDPTGISPINFTVTFSEPVTGFNESDITLSGTAGATTVVLSGTGPAYNIAVSGMTQDGTVVINIPDNVCIDLAGNPNTTSVNTDNSVNYDITVPGVTIEQASGQSDPTGISPINFTVTFSEPVTGFDESDITLSGTAGATTVVLSGTGPEYNIAVSGMTQDGTVVISIPDNVCIDLAGNPNTTSVNTDNSVNYDITVPGVTIEQASGQLDPTGISPINFTVTFSEPVTGFNESDITLSGTAGATTVVISGTGPAYNIAVSGMTQNGTVVINIPDNVCIDLAGNSNLESFSSQVEYLNEEITKFQANNIFTPNSNFNRYWIIRNISLYIDYELIIVNSSGQKIYQTVNYQNNWNGTYKNQALPTGTYFYSFSSPDKKTVYKGFINIIYE